MYAYIKGIYEDRNLDYIVVENNGIGYKIFMSENSMKKIGIKGENVKVYTYLKVREDDMSLYGFASREEQQMFELLISVSGIGTKSAITILSNIEPAAFAVAVVSDDISVLKKLPGIGPKSAQRIILELKDKLKSYNIDQSEVSSELKAVIEKNQNIDEFMSAMIVLGYSQKEAEDIIPKLSSTELGLEEMIKEALKIVAG